MTSELLFHPYEALLAVADGRDGVSLWAYEEGERWWSLRNGNPAGSRLTGLEWLNEDGPSRLAVASDDGVVRVWGGVQDDGSVGGGGAGEPAVRAGGAPAGGGGCDELYEGPRLVASFAACPDVAHGGDGSGLVTAYGHPAGLLFAGGHAPKLRLWDLRAEQCAASWAADPGGGACVTTLCCAAQGAAWQSAGPGSLFGAGPSSSPPLGPAVVLAGYGDGALRLFDARLPSERKQVASWHEHQAWVVAAHLSSEYGAVSGSVAGDVNLFDLRTSGALRTIDTLANTQTTMTAMAVHPAAPVLAVGSHAQFIKVMTLNGYSDSEEFVLKWIKYHDGFLGQRIGPVSCLTFHPNRAVMAAGATDSIISVYSNSA